jgi:hypothetical protein
MIYRDPPLFTVDVRALLSDDEHSALPQHVVTRPNAGDVIGGCWRFAENSVDGRGKGQAWRYSRDLLPRRRAGSDSDDSDLLKKNIRRPDAEREYGTAKDQCGVVTLDKKLFKRLVDSMGQMDETVRGVRAPSREFYVDAAKVREIRAIWARPPFLMAIPFLSVKFHDGLSRIPIGDLD